MQSVKPERLHTLAKSLESAIRQLTKSDVLLELIELECAAKIVAQEQNLQNQKSVKSSHDDTVTRDSDDSDSEDSSSDSEDSSSDSESSDSSSSSDGSETSCDVIKTNNVTKDSDDSTDEEASHKAKSQIEILEKDFNAINIQTEEKSVSTQNQLIAENNPPADKICQTKESNEKNAKKVDSEKVETAEELTQILEKINLL